MKKRFIELLRSTGREGVDGLLGEMEQNGFFTAPCSTSFHLANEGGLLEHSLNVCDYAIELAKALKVDAPIESIILVSLLHDLGKAGQFGKSNYIPNYVRSKTKNKETGEYDQVLSTAKPYATNPELIYEEHEIRSVNIAAPFIELTEEEQHAIIHHNGLWGKLDSTFSSTFDKHQLSLLIHYADLWCSRFVEVD